MSLQEKDSPPWTGENSNFRTIVAFKSTNNDKVFFVYGFAISQRDNINDMERHELAIIAKHYLEATETVLDSLIASGELIEVEEVEDDE